MSVAKITEKIHLARNILGINYNFCYYALYVRNEKEE